MIQAGRFRHNLTIYSRDTTTAGTSTDTEIAKLRCSKREPRGIELLKDATLRSEQLATWTTYQRDGITTNMIGIDDQGQEYEITSIADPTGMRRVMEITTTERD